MRRVGIWGRALQREGRGVKVLGDFKECEEYQGLKCN